MSRESIELITPVGRLIGGSLYEPQTTDQEGRLLVDKAGNSMVKFWFILAIPKGTETLWSQTEWGAQIYRIGQLGWPQAYQSPSFAWKISDGDSTIPNRKGNAPCNKIGYPGNWIIRFSGGYAPVILKIVNNTPTVWIDKNMILPGDYIQVRCDVKANDGSKGSPGLYLNPSHVAHAYYGTRIEIRNVASSMDIKTINWGNGGPVPIGASLTPVGGMETMAPVAGNSVPAAQPYTPPAAAPAPVTVTPHTGILNPPLPLAATVAPAPGRVMLVNDFTYDQYIASGWTDAALIANGKMRA
jgi:hypothetical protein